MSKWIAAGEPPDKIKVSLEIKKSKNPDLVAWMHALPYGKASVLIREILDEVVKTGKFSGFSGVQPAPAAPNPSISPAMVPALPFAQVLPNGVEQTQKLNIQDIALPTEKKQEGGQTVDATTLRKLKEFRDMC